MALVGEAQHDVSEVKELSSSRASTELEKGIR